MDCKCVICQNNKPFDMPEEIITSVQSGDLVLFCGAGISTEGKTVLPYSFYSSIQEELDMDNPALPFSELMQLYCDQANGRKKLLQAIRKRFQYIHSFPELERQATAFHRELSEIYQIRTIITTNWDTYFEKCCGAIPITIPQDFAFWDDSSRYVIKIHGSINNLGSIIATKDDYQHCYESLQNGIIGATIKSILSTKTVVFIGFSFGDEDFARIIDYLRKELGEIYPHIYIVTLDETLSDRINYDRSTVLLTSGTFFLHRLKNELIERGLIVNCSAQNKIPSVLDILRDVHAETSEIDLTEYPSAIFTLAYQDGIIHSFERYLQNRNTGEYNKPGYVAHIVKNYDVLAKLQHINQNYWTEAYYIGYSNGLVLIGACDDIFDETIRAFPLFYLPNVKNKIDSIETLIHEIEKTSSPRSKYYRFAKKLVEERGGKDIIMHHPPL